jgi:DNA-binding transcriptional LysR family regulator
VPDIFSKYAMQLAGFGFGYLPEPYARPAIDAGLLVELQVEEQRPVETLHLAWRPEEEGAALNWWLERLRRPGCLQQLFENTAVAHFSISSARQT